MTGSYAAHARRSLLFYGQAKVRPTVIVVTPVDGFVALSVRNLQSVFEDVASAVRLLKLQARARIG